MPGQVHFRIRIQQKDGADGPNVLTGENEILYLIGRCAAGNISKKHLRNGAYKGSLYEQI
jgi:hypothetical protein